MTNSADATYDLIIVGSGAGALIAAVRASSLGASVLVLEKTDLFGGTSATSGAGVWVPNNRYAPAIGVEDSDDEAFRYMRSIIPADQVSDDTIHNYIAVSKEMITYLESIGIKYRAVPGYADYYPSIDGWKNGGRTLDCTPFDGRKLGKDLYKLRGLPRANAIFGRINMSVLESVQIFAQTSGWQKLLRKVILGYVLDLPHRFFSWRDRRLTMGNALVGGLYASAKENGVDIRLSTPVKELIFEGSKVTGVVAGAADASLTKFHARRGVILACGGFEHNSALRAQYLPGPTSSEWSVGNAGNTGDLIPPVRKIGAKLALMNEAWWVPTIRSGDTQVGLFFEKSKPNLMIVNRHGKRFMNESITYNSYGEWMYRQGDANEPVGVPAFVIFDKNYRLNYPFGGMIQARYMPDWMSRSAFRNNGALKKANSLSELAEKLGIDSAGLAETAVEMRAYSQSGIDPQFHRGSDQHDRMYGDQSVTPNPCLGPLSRPPYYGARVYPGDIGTKGGFVIDSSARVLDQQDAPILGLYAAGNCTASIMGDKYPGAGCTLGPAMTMAFIAASHAMDVAPTAPHID